MIDQQEKWNKRFTINKLQNYSKNLTDDYDQKIFNNVQEDLIPIKKAFLEKRRKIFRDFTVSKKQIEETKIQKKIQERKNKIIEQTKILKKQWQSKQLLSDPFFRELLKNIKFSIEEKNLLEKLQTYIEDELPYQIKTIDLIDNNFKSLTNCYWQIKEIMNRINTFQNELQVEENIDNLINQIDDYRKLNLIFFEKLVEWKLKNELQGYYLFEGQQLCSLKLFVWRNKNVYREIALNYNNLQSNTEKKHVSLSQQDMFFLRAYFKFEDKIVSLRNDQNFLNRVLKIEKLFETMDNNYQSFVQKYQIECNKNDDSRTIDISQEESSYDYFNNTIILQKKNTEQKIQDNQIKEQLNKKFDNNEIQIIFDTNQNYIFERAYINEEDIKKFFYFHITQLDQEYSKLIQQHFKIFKQQINNCNCPYFYCLKLDKNFIQNKQNQQDKYKQNFNDIFGFMVFDVQEKHIKIIHLSVRKNFSYIDFFKQTLNILQQRYFKDYIFSIKYKKINNTPYELISKELLQEGFKMKTIYSKKQPIVELQLNKKLNFQKGIMSIEIKFQNDDKIILNEHNIHLRLFISFSNKYRLFYNLNSMNKQIDLNGYYFYVFQKYILQDKNYNNLNEIPIWKKFYSGNFNVKSKYDLKDIQFENYDNFDQSFKTLQTFEKQQLLRENINKEQFKLTISNLTQNLQLLNSYIIQYNNKDYLRISPSKVFYKLKGKKLDYQFYLIPSKNSNFYFYFTRIEKLESLLSRFDYKINKLVSKIFSNFDLNKFKKCEEALYIKTFSISLTNQKNMDLVNLFANINSVDINSITFDFEFSITGNKHESGLIYNINKNNTLEDQFLFGVIHAEIDQQIKYPLFSFLKCDKEIQIPKN